jgi:hypothetical protein
MNTKFILRTVICVALISVFFSGCEVSNNQKTPSVSKKTDEQTTTSQTVQPTKEDKQQNETQGVEDIQKVEMNSADTTLYNAALKYKDASYCDKISLQEGINKCKDDVKSTIVVNAALKSLDPKKCDELANQSDIDVCKTQIEVAKTEKMKADQKNADLNANEDILIQAMDKQDASLCQKITDDTQKQLCVDKLYIIEAATKKDKTLCDKIVNSDQKKYCLLNFGPQ